MVNRDSNCCPFVPLQPMKIVYLMVDLWTWLMFTVPLKITLMKFLYSLLLCFLWFFPFPCQDWWTIRITDCCSSIAISSQPHNASAQNYPYTNATGSWFFGSSGVCITVMSTRIKSIYMIICNYKLSWEPREHRDFESRTWGSEVPTARSWVRSQSRSKSGCRGKTDKVCKKLFGKDLVLEKLSVFIWTSPIPRGPIFLTPVSLQC